MVTCTCTFSESVYIGETSLTKNAVEKLVKSLGDDYRGDRYHLLGKNCNHFTAELAKELTGVEVPGWINRLASVSGSIPFIGRVLPQEWLSPITPPNSDDDAASPTTSARLEPSTLNFPARVERAEDALKVCAPANDHHPHLIGECERSACAAIARARTALLRKRCAYFPARQPALNGTSWKLFTRRASETPTAQAGSRAHQPLARLWTSIKSLTTDAATSPSTPMPTLKPAVVSNAQ